MKKIVLIIGIIALAIVGFCTYKKSNSYKLQKEIASNILRFHVRANSDSDEDQALKLMVKNEVVKYIQNELHEVDTLDEAKNILYYDMDAIETIALGVIDAEGYKYNVKVYFEKSYFPMKMYGDMCFPPGEYEAFRIDIGESAGKNWWCVLYPTLCYVDMAYSVVPDESKEELRAILSEEAYDTIDNTYEYRFKYLTFLNKNK